MNYYFSCYPSKQSNAGGFSFLNLLVKVLKKNRKFKKNWQESDLILINSHHWINSAFKIIFLRLKGKRFVLRIDGPLSLYRSSNIAFFEDRLIYSFALNISSGIIFQSEWSAKENFNSKKSLQKLPFAIIYNGGRNHYFKKSLVDRDEACLFVANSINKFKGFDLFKDFAKKSLLIEELKDLQFYSAGNVDSFKEDLINIKNCGSLNKEDLSKLMQKVKYYIHPSIYEACSNALIESINNGMIPFVYNGTSNTEIVRDKRLKFKNIDELISMIIKIRKDKTNKFELLNLNIEESAESYIHFFNKIISMEDRKINYLNIINFCICLILYELSLLFEKLKSLSQFILKIKV